MSASIGADPLYRDWGFLLYGNRYIPHGSGDAQGDYRCAFHPNLQAIARCVGCGRFLCPYCRRVVRGRNFCGYCAHAAEAFPPPPYLTPGIAVPEPRLTPRRDLPFPQARWGVGEAFLVFMIAVALSTSLTLSIKSIFSLSLSSWESKILFIFIASVSLYGFLLGGTFFSVKRRHKAHISSLGIRFKGLAKGIAMGLALGIPLFIGAVVLAYFSQRVFPPTKTDILMESVTGISSSAIRPWAAALLLITLVVLAPVCEEVFFRGYLYPALRNRIHAQLSMILCGILFAAAHFELIGFLPRALLGSGLSFMYEKSRTLGGPIVGHALYNGLLVLLISLL